MESEMMEGMEVERPAYRHYFRRMGADQRRALIEHKLGHYPLVDVYELLPIPLGGTPSPKFYLYYGHDELEALLTAMGEGRLQAILGTPLERLLAEYDVNWDEDDSLGDVVNDFLDAFFALPRADEMEHKVSDWVDKHRDRVMKDLKRRGEWNDVRWFAWPEKLIVGQSLAVGGTTITPFVNVEHLGYDTLALIAAQDLGNDAGGNPRQFIDVMAVLRR